MAKNEIKVLHGLEHIQQRPGMYIGSTENPNHLLQEVLDNAIDEAINKFANKISVKISENIVTICDNGRGFPIHEVTLPDGKTSDSVIASICELFSGSKFDNRNYDFSIGTHGVGLTAVNALSTNMNMSIKKDNKIHFYRFQNSKFIDKTIFDSGKSPDNIWWSTRVDFQPDPKYFESTKFELDNIVKELLYIVAKYDDLKILFNEKELKKISIIDYIKSIFKLEPNTPIFNISYTDITSAEKIFIYFTYDQNSAKDNFGSVNLKFCGGTFLTSFATIYYNIVKNEFLNYDYVNRNDILNNFKYFIDVQIKTPKYSSQDKTKMTSNILYLFEKIKPKLSSILNSESFFKNIYENIQKEKSNKTLSKLIKNTRGKRVSSDNPLKDCENMPGEILYILEGDSAEGTLKSIRDSKTEAILPVNGKVINTITNTKEKILSTKGKFRFILESLGINLEENNISKKDYRYRFIKLICDADPDGLHISVLLALGIWKFAPDIIKQKRLSIILPPLFGAVKKDKFIPIYNRSDIDSYRNSGYSIKRFKGLGEMNPSELDHIIHNPVEYIIEAPKSEKDDKFVELLITNTEVKKKICLNKNFGFNKMLSLISQSSTKGNI